MKKITGKVSETQVNENEGYWDVTKKSILEVKFNILVVTI